MRKDGAPRSTFRRRIGKIRQVSLAGVDHKHAGVARGFQHRTDRLHRARELGHVIAERFTETAGLHEVALHVNDEKSAGRPVELDRLRLGYDNAPCWLG